jgi:hypothetical protein
MLVQITSGKALINGGGRVQRRRLVQIERGDYSPRAQVVLSSADARDIPFTEIVQRLEAAGHGHELII